jgi:hypothetical protein
MGALTGGAAAGASAITKEAIMQGDYGSDEALAEIAQGAITGAIMAGSTYYSQVIFRKAASLGSGAAAAQMVKGAAPPPLWRTLASEAGEEILSEGLSVGAESFLVLLDPNTWEEGFGEGMRQAKGEIAAKLAATPMNMLKASLAVVATGAINRGVGGDRNMLDQKIGEAGKINPRANFAAMLRDQPNALVEGAVTMGIDSAVEGKINADDLAPGLFQAYLEEAKEGAITAHVASAHAGTSRTWVKKNLDSHGDRMTAAERADYLAMHQVAVENQGMWTGGDEAGTNIFVSAEEYIRMREVAAMQAAKQWMDETGGSLSREELAAFVQYCRESEDSREFARRMQEDPTVVAARKKIADDANKLDAELDKEAGLEPLGADELALLEDVEGTVASLARVNVSEDPASKEKRSELEAAVSGLIDRLKLGEMSAAERQRRLSRLSRKARNYVVVRIDRARRDAVREEAGEHAGLELHNHFMGVAGPEVFVSRVQKHEAKKPGNEGKSEWELTLDAIARLKDSGLGHGVGEDGKVRRGVSGDALALVVEAQGEIAEIRQAAEATETQVDEDRIQEIAEQAVRKALVATEETDFNSAYEVRDELIKQYFGKANEVDKKGQLKPDFSLVTEDELAAAREGAERTGKSAQATEAVLPAYADYAREAIAVLIDEGQSYTEQSQSLNKLLRSFPKPMLERLVNEAVAPKLAKITDDLEAGRISREEADRRRDAARLVFRNLAMIPTGLFAPTDAKGKREFVARSGKEDPRPELSPEQRDLLRREDQELRDAVAAQDGGVKEPAGLREHGDAFVKQQEELGLFEQLERGDTNGVDIAGLEEFKLTAAGRARFRAFYRRLAEIGAAQGRRVVLRPHVGEGSLDLADPSKPHGIDNAARGGERKGQQGEGPTAEELTHYDRARHNVEALLSSLEELHAMGELDPEVVEVRFGHATHATPEQILRLQALGVIAEVNLHSNVRTHSLDPTNPKTGELESERFEDHALLGLIYYQADLVLSTDAHSVMSTSLAGEYSKANLLIERFLHGELPLRLRPEDAGDRGQEVSLGTGTSTQETVRELYVGDLSSEELQRFLGAYEKIMSFAEGYRDDAIARERERGGGR